MSGHAGHDPLVQAARPLIAAATQFRWQASAPDVRALQQQLIEALGEFEAAAAAAGVARDDRLAARYLLCAFVDDLATATPWGGGGGWAPFSLLAHFHREVPGGSRVFALLSRLAETPERRRGVLELYLVCLGLGLEGSHRGTADGAQRLQEIRARLFRLLFPEQAAASAPAGQAGQSSHARPPEPLSVDWQPALTGGPPRINGLPLWAIVSVIATATVVLYLGLNLWLSRSSDQAFAKIRSVRFASVPEPVAQPRRELKGSPLSAALAAELGGQRLVLRESSSQSVLSLAAERLFEPGTARLTEPAQQQLERIAAALKPLAGPILVSGHADANAARSAAFPSVWHLTDAQSRAVARRLRELLPARTLQTEALGDRDSPGAQPGDDDALPAQRVDIALFPGQ